MLIRPVEAAGSADYGCVGFGAFFAVAVVSACWAWAVVYAGEVGGVVGVDSECSAFGPGGFVVDGVGVGVAAFVADVGEVPEGVSPEGSPCSC